MIFSNRLHVLNEGHRMHLRILGIPEVRMIDADPVEYAEARRIWKKTLPHASEATLHTKALGHLAHKQHHARLLKENETSVERHLRRHSRVQTWLIGLFVFVLLLLLFSQHAHAQFSKITAVQTKSAGSNIGFHASPFVINCSTNTACTDDGFTFNITASSTAATAWSALTAATNNNAGTFAVNGNTWDFSLATLLKARFSAGLTTSTNGDFGQDSTTGFWHFWQNAHDRLLIASTNVGASGQAFLSNADGSGSFADPIVSGPDAPGAASTKNPVQVGCNFFTTPSTLANNNVGQIQCDSAQNVLVNLKTAIPAGSNVIGHVIVDSAPSTAVTIADAADTTLGAKADAKSTATDTTAITIMQVLKEISAMEQAPASRAVTNAGTFADQATLQAGSALAGEIVPVTTATTTDTALRCTLASAASTNSTNCKNAAGNVYGYRFINTTTTVYYLRMYNSSSAPTCSSATGFVESIPIPPAGAAGGAGGIVSMEPFGEGYSTGISFCFTGGSSSTDNTNAATGVFGSILYK